MQNKIKIPQLEICPELEHLTIEEIERLQDEYLEGSIKVKDLMEKYDLSGFTYNALRGKLPPKIDRSMACPECNTYGVAAIQGRYTSLGKTHCPVCNKKLVCDFRPSFSRISNFVNIPRSLSNITPTIEPSFWDNEFEFEFKETYLTYDEFIDLNVEQRVFLASIIRTCLSEDMQVIKGEEISSFKICPTYQYFEEIVNSLVSKKVIPTDKLNSLRIYIHESLSEIMFLPFDNRGVDSLALLELWKKIAYHEVVEYYTYKLLDINLPVNIGDKAELTINTLLEKLSVSQIFNLIYWSVKDACEFIVAGRGTKKHAANTVLYNCLKKSERWLQSDYPIKTYNRPKLHCPQSEMSAYFFDSVLGIGDQGFYDTPSIELIEQRFSISLDDNVEN